MSNLDCKKPQPCNPPAPPTPHPPTPEFDQCIAIDWKMHWDGTHMTRERVRNTPDGTYTQITVQDGCIVALGYCPEPIYTPPYCNPNPAPCQDGGGGSGSVRISQSPGNTIVQNGDGLYARTYVTAGNGIAVSGTGTLADPYIVSLAAQTNSGYTKVVVGWRHIVAETDVLGTTKVGMERSGVNPGRYQAATVTVDEFGVVTDIEAIGEEIVKAGRGLASHHEGDTLVLEHPQVNVDSPVVFGGYVVAVNNSGHITETTRAITLAAGIYNFGVYDVGVNEWGSISSITQRTDHPATGGTFTTGDGRTVTYDNTGRITGVDGNGGGGGGGGGGVPGGGMPAPIREMYHITPAVGNNPPVYDRWGDKLQFIETTVDKAVIRLPGYVTSEAQVHVSIHGDVSWFVDLAARTLTIYYPTDARIAVAFRG